MTYCVGIKLDAGLVFASDSRTNAGLDHISTFRKMMVYERAGDRFMVLLSAGNLSIAQAYISDHTTPENRAKSFGVIGVAFGVGFMFGPGIGGLLAEYGMHVPFFAAAALSLLSIICTYTLLSSEKPPAQSTTGPLPGGRRPSAFDIATYAEYFGRPQLGRLYLQFYTRMSPLGGERQRIILR